MDEDPLDLRPAHEQALHPQDQVAGAGRLDDFVACYRPGARRERTESDRFHRFTYDEIAARDKASLDIFWLRDESLEDTDDLPAPGVIAAEIVEDLQAALTEFAELAESLQGIGVEVPAGDGCG